MRLQKDPVIAIGNHRRPTFLLGFITLGMVPIEWCMTMMRLQCPINCLMESLLVKGMEVGVGRNYLAEYAMKMKPRSEFLLMIGDDMLASWNSLLVLYEEMKKGEHDVMSGLYFMKADQYSQPMAVMSRSDVEGYMVPGVHFQVGEIVPVDIVCGMDFTMIRTDIFDDLGPQPWFQSSNSRNMLDTETGGLSLFTEDTFFIKKVTEAKKSVAVHTGCRIGHMTKNGEVY